MNNMIVKGKWRQTRGAVRKQWGKLTNDDVAMFLGDGEQLVGKLQERYGYTKKQAQQEVAKFMDSLHDDLPLTEEREHAADSVRQHPWLTGIFFGGIVLLMAGYVLNRFFHIVEIEQIREDPA